MSRPTPKISIIQVAAAQLQIGTYAEIVLPFVADFILIPQYVVAVDNESIVENGDPDAAYAIKFNDISAPPLIFDTNGLGPGHFAVFEGAVTKFYIAALLVSPNVPLSVLIGTDCDVGAGYAVFPTS